jgi:hypothetical protein
MILERMPTAKLESLRAEVGCHDLPRGATSCSRNSIKLLAIIGNAGSKARGKKRSVAAKYLNPENADEVWSGRGHMPLWLGAEIKADKAREDFLID